MQLDFGKSAGINATNTIAPDLLKKIIAGAESGNKDSTYFYALLKFYGNSVPKDINIAFSNFKKAALLGHREAQTAYAIMLVTGDVIEPDFNEALIYLRKSVADGDKDAHWLLAVMLMELSQMQLKAREIDQIKLNDVYKESLVLLHKAADEYHLSHAEYYIGLMNEYGFGTPQNLFRALEYYKRASEQYHVESMYNLALMYAYGRGTQQDYRRAFMLFDNSVRYGGHKSAAYYLGLFRLHGYSCQPNYDIAVNWFEYASGSDDPAIADKAMKAGNEIREMMELAAAENHRQAETFRAKSEKIQKRLDDEDL